MKKSSRVPFSVRDSFKSHFLKGQSERLYWYVRNAAKGWENLRKLKDRAKNKKLKEKLGQEKLQTRNKEYTISTHLFFCENFMVYLIALQSAVGCFVVMCYFKKKPAFEAFVCLFVYAPPPDLETQLKGLNGRVKSRHICIHIFKSLMNEKMLQSFRLCP